MSDVQPPELPVGEVAGSLAPEARLAPAPEGVTVRPGTTLAAHTAWRTGGACGAFVVVHDRKAAGRADAWCRAAGFKRTWLGHTTRTVVRDGGLAGAVIRLGRGFQRIEPMAYGAARVGAGTPLAVLAVKASPASALRALRWRAGSLGAAVLCDDGPGPGWLQLVDRVHVLRRGKDVAVPLADARANRWPVLEVVLVAGAFDPGALPPTDVSSEVLAPEASKTSGRTRRKKKKAVVQVPPPPSAWWVLEEDGIEGGLAAEIRAASLNGTRLRDVALPAAEPTALVNLGAATAADLQLLETSVLQRLYEARGLKPSSRITWLGRVS